MHALPEADGEGHQAVDGPGDSGRGARHIRENGNGERSHKFSRRCPTCGNWLPWYKAIKSAAIPDLSPRLPKADVFYFDRTSRGAVTLAQHARLAGAVVVFEPSAESDPKLLDDALAAAHVAKIAVDRRRGNEGLLLTAKGPELIIETLGADGCLKRLPWGTSTGRPWHRRTQSIGIAWQRCRCNLRRLTGSVTSKLI